MATLLQVSLDMYNNKGYEYVYGGSGGDRNNNGIQDIDCSHLVFSALRAAGYSIPYMTTSALNSAEALAYFDIVPLEDATPEKDDLILYEGHVGIFKDFSLSKNEGTFFGSQHLGPGIARFDEDEIFGWGLGFIILRPKKEMKTKAPMTKAVPTKHMERWAQRSGRNETPSRWRTDSSDETTLHLRWGGIRMTK